MIEQRPLKVFLCHASADKPAVYKVYRYLRTKDIDPWLDAEKLLPGQKWQIEIPKALYDSDAIIVFLSKSSISKEGFVQKEIKFALDKALEMPEDRIFLIPARLEECDVPESLKSYHWVDLFEKGGNRKLLQSLHARAAQLGLSVPLSSAEELQSLLASASMDFDSYEETSHSPEKPVRVESAHEAEAPRKEREPQESGSVDIGGDVKDSTIITGDHNIIIQSPSGEYEVEPKKKNVSKPSKKNKRKFNLQKTGIFGLFLIGLLLGGWGIKYLAELPVTVSPTATDVNPMKEIEQLATGTASARTAAATSKPPTPTLTPSPIVTVIPTPTLGIGSTKISEKDGMTMMLVPAGEFTMGSDNGDADEKPVHQVYLDSYWIDQTEVTNKMYALCVEAGVCQPPSSTSSYARKEYYGNSNFDDYPVIRVDWNKAKTYCEWAGRRLPTEAEWEKAARGTDGRNYPWGDGINCSRANYNFSCMGDTTEVGSYISGQSPYGLFDMVGNVWEWVSDWYDSTYYSNSISVNPQGPASGQSHVVRGGSWHDTDYPLSSAYRNRGHPFDFYYYFGFRCALSAE